MYSLAVNLDGLIVQQLDAIWAETMVSGSLLGTNACDDAKRDLVLWTAVTDFRIYGMGSRVNRALLCHAGLSRSIVL